jgi:tetratricopeptide (TPR) repeat protein
MKKSEQTVDQKSRAGEAGQTVKFIMNPSVLKTAATFLCFSVLGFFIYSHTLNGPFIFDDKAKIRGNTNIRMTELNLENLLKAGSNKKGSLSMRPVGYFTYALNYYFHRYDLKGYHIVNIIIHILTSIFLYAFIKTTLSLPSIKFKDNQAYAIATFAALIWLVHPLQTQSVTYIMQRLNSLAAMFYVLSFWLYLKGRLAEERQKIWLWFACSCLAWILALGCKQIAVTLPFFALLFEWYFFQDLSKVWLKRHLKYLLGISAFCILLFLIYTGFNPWEKIQSLHDYARQEFTITQRLFTQFRVVILYLSLIFLPLPSRLNLDYDFPLSFSLINPVTTLISLGAIISLLAFAFYLAKRERLISFCILWFFGNLVIESSILPLALVFEHRNYLPSMMVCLIPSLLVYRYLKTDRLRIGLLCLVAVLLAVWTYQRNGVWQSPLTLWTDVVKKSPNNDRAHANLGIALAKQGEHDEAIEHYHKALQINPNFHQAHNNLGVVLNEQGNTNEAIEHYHKALQIDPDFAKAHHNLGAALAKQGKINEAVEHYHKALQLNPDDSETLFNLGDALARQGKTEQAINYLSKALQINPDYAEVHSNLGSIYIKQGNIEKAIYHSNQALRLNPQLAEAHNNIGIALMQEAKIEAAIGQFQKALQLKPDFIMAENNLKRALTIRQELETEISRLQELLKDNPENVELHFQLGNLFFRKGDQRQAMQQYKKALQLNPKFVPALNNLALVRAANKEYDKALTLFLDVLNYYPDDAETHYNIACMYSQLEKVDESIEWLTKAIDRGYTNWESIKTDGDLENIRNAAGYKALIKDH